VSPGRATRAGTSGHEGRVTVVYGVLLEPQLVAGVEKPFAIMNATLAAVFVLDLHVWCYVPVAAGIHFLLRHATRHDPFMRPIYIRYNRQADAYDPWCHARIDRCRARPRGWGRGTLC